MHLAHAGGNISFNSKLNWAQTPLSLIKAVSFTDVRPHPAARNNTLHEGGDAASVSKRHDGAGYKSFKET